MKSKNTLIVGGTSGLGLELGLLFAEEYRVIVTGRHDPGRAELECRLLDLALERRELGAELDALVAAIPSVDLLVYAAGFSQQGTLDRLEDREIDAMTSVGLLAPAMLIQRLLRKQHALQSLIAVTSTSQWVPRPHEPIYTAVKAGLAMLGNSLSLDPNIGKTIVAAPAGMVTPFWRMGGKDVSGMLEAPWVARQIFSHFPGNFRYKWIRVLRDPPRVEVGETR